MTAQDKLTKQIEQGKHITVGLDSDISKIPIHLHSSLDPILDFNKAIIDKTAKYAASYKINFAFYEKDGPAGLDIIKKTIEYIPSDNLIIGDAKRGDIGNTSEMYALSIFNYFGCDSVTLNPYMGIDSIDPFLKYENKISFILALTSNKSSADFEMLKLNDGSFVYEKVIDKTNSWNTKENCGIVFGATNLSQLQNSIESFKKLYILLPGIGAQGGSLEEVVSSFKKADNNRFLINVSRSLIYKDSTVNYALAAEQEMISLNRQIDKVWNR